MPWILGYHKKDIQFRSIPFQGNMFISLFPLYHTLLEQYLTPCPLFVSRTLCQSQCLQSVPSIVGEVYLSASVSGFLALGKFNADI